MPAPNCHLPAQEIRPYVKGPFLTIPDALQFSMICSDPNQRLYIVTPWMDGESKGTPPSLRLRNFSNLP